GESGPSGTAFSWTPCRRRSSSRIRLIGSRLGRRLQSGYWRSTPSPAEETLVEAPDSAVHQVGLFGFERGVRVSDVDIELRRPADRGAAFHVIALGPLS